MAVFAFVSMYIMPAAGVLFIVALLRAIKKIVQGKSYSAEVFWSSVLFAGIVWTISVTNLLTD
ncbi:hypothetical protein [Paenibacillus humicola]|uniref:hypothetical protein n=1 Tax=Paenibacillus humicola TaxID=3110540 RepID=UPI00237BD49F|nr:hypothetical protein [Paenibacillus humicola]